jgi:hypothetical protein
VSTISVARGRLDAASSRIQVPYAATAALSLVLLLGSAYAALERPAAAPAPVAVPAGPVDRVALVVAGIPAVVTPDTAVPVTADLSVRVALERVPGRAASRDLHIAVIDGTGSRAPGSRVSLTGQMRYMDHGSFDAIAEPEAGGGHVAHLTFAMPGEYELRLVISGAGSTGSVLLDLDLN